MKSFDDVVSGNLNEGLYDKWEVSKSFNDDDFQKNLKYMILDIMKKIDGIDGKIDDLISRPHAD